ncbi:replication initiation protein [Haloechinothrix sp. YIM 98757]|uniref:Replication initiation protein n=1 Tax=Haloechinothrix aidingensis TaxID=2752311 RepID=A0A838A5H7_9PSEU|nr:replication initiator [Haloechinothrix aidingensis]MBA0124238.1 replication initiation protein [Haloechinothrix aidingensis]
MSTVDTSVSDSDGSAPHRQVAPVLEDIAAGTAEELGVCLRPIALKRVDTHTGEAVTVPVPCGATQSSVCPSCADKARRLRIHQARQGWHLAAEPQVETSEPTTQQRAALGQLADLTEARAHAAAIGDERAVADIDQEIDAAHQLLQTDGLRGSPSKPGESTSKRRVRSTRRRQDTPDLPRRPVQATTTGRVFTAPDGKQYRPSTFLTLTLDSYGPVHTASPKPQHPKPCRCGQVHRQDEGIVGTPVDPASYDYRRAARDAIHFGKLIDRFWQNLRRAVGWNVQYFATVEPQQRLAMHLHAAVRGTIPRTLLRQVTQATYHQVWWPQHDHPVYSPEHPPAWDGEDECYRDPNTGTALTPWDEAIEATLEPDAQPAHVARFGPNGIDAQGVTAGSDKAGKCLGYLVKYLTKDLDACYEPTTDPERDHLDRLAAELQRQPCSETCPNWLLYGIQPDHPHEGMTPGACSGKAHRPAHLGYRGRRCLVSRKWSGHTLSEHKDQRREHVLKTLGAVGTTPQMATPPDDEPGRYRWVPLPHDGPNPPDRTQLLLHAIAQKRRWRQQYHNAVTELSATTHQAA